MKKIFYSLIYAYLENLARIKFGYLVSSSVEIIVKY